MALENSGYVVLSGGATGKRRAESWAEILRRWLIECPQCAQVWFVVGASENDRHVCKDCGHSFVIRFTGAPKDNQFNSVRAAREQK